MNFYKKLTAFCLCLLSVCSLAFTDQLQLKDDYWDGEQYLNNSSLQYRWALSYIEKLHLKGNERILDIGCGDGRITAMIAQAVPNGQVIGIDISDSMLLTAQRLLDSIHFTNLAFMKRNAMNLNFENEFDLIVSFSCLHWVSDHSAALREIGRGLKPQGKVFLYFAPDHGRDRFDHALETVINSEKWSSYFNGFINPLSLVTPARFAAYAEEAHLLLKRMEIVTVDEVFPDKAAFAAWMTGWMSYLKQLPKELHREFLDEIIECHLIKYPLDEEGRIHYVDYWMEVELLKSA